MKKFILTLNFIPQLTFGMNDEYEYGNENDIENLNIDNIIQENNIIENININNIFEKNNKEKNNFDIIKSILKKDVINYDEYKILLDTFENKDSDYIVKILEKIEKDNIVKSQDIENIIKIKDNKGLLKNKIEEDVNYIINVFINKFFYNFSDNVDLYSIYIVIHTIRLILERSLSIRDLIIKSFSENDYNFILSDFEDNNYFCDNLNKVLNKYNRNLDINFIKKIIKGKIKEKDTNAFFETFYNFFIITFNNEYITKDYYIPEMFLNNSKKDFNVLDELINIDKNIDKEILEKTICIMFTTLHEFNHFILRLIKSIKSEKIEKYPYSTKEIKNDLIENFKNHENFKDYYDDVNFYLNNKFELEDVYNNVNENLIKNYTSYSLTKFNKDYSKLSEYDKKLIADFINLKKYKIEISENKNELKKYQFFKYLYDKNFFFGDKYSLDIKYYRLKTNEELYNDFMKLSNSFFAPNYILDKKENDNMWSFYRFLLFKQYNFNENTFDSKIDEYLENTYTGEYIKKLKTRDYSYVKDIIIKVNTGECLADVFAYSNMPFKIQKGMRSLGYWQRNLFKYFAELYKNQNDNKYKEDDNKEINENKDEKNNKKCIIM